MKTTLNKIHSILLVVLAIVTVVQGLFIRENGKESHQQQHRIEINEGAAERDREYTAWLQWKVDQARVATGLTESGFPPPKK